MSNKKEQTGFSLAEILIALTVLGVAAMLTLPQFIQDFREKMEKEQVRTVKYKLTQATDKMKSLDLIGPYESTEKFINVLKQHYKVIKICDNINLAKCWPSKTILTADGEVAVNSITTGEELKALTYGSAQTKTMGLVTADGISMILAYSPVCSQLDPMRTYEWSTEDSKPVTNATTNCISAIFDINGGKKPNRLGKDVRTLNSLFGAKKFQAIAMSKEDCERNKTKYGLNGCYYEKDYFAGAVKACADIGLHLADMQTLANLAGAKYGRTDIDVHTLIMRNDYNEGDGTFTGNCDDFFKTHDINGRYAISDVICVNTLQNDINSAVASIDGYFWSSSEVSATLAEKRNFSANSSAWAALERNNSNYTAFCVGD